MQDVKCRNHGGGTDADDISCKLRTYNYPVDAPGSPVNYGALPQTWEDPRHVQEDTGEGGDNDPIDVLELGLQPCYPGEVRVVRVLGAFAMVDRSGDGVAGETDWKLLVVPTAATVQTGAAATPSPGAATGAYCVLVQPGSPRTHASTLVGCLIPPSVPS